MCSIVGGDVMPRSLLQISLYRGGDLGLPSQSHGSEQPCSQHAGQIVVLWWEHSMWMPYACNFNAVNVGTDTAARLKCGRIPMLLAVCRSHSRGHRGVLLCALMGRHLAWSWCFLSLCSAGSRHSSVQEATPLCCEHLSACCHSAD